MAPTTNLIRHVMRAHQIHPDTEILLIGTFNPDAPGNAADFFYGRSRNYLWKLIPTAFGDPSLKGAAKAEKLAYIRQRKIDFIDLITEVHVEEALNYDDRYLDSRISAWSDVIAEIDTLPRLTKVGFTRRTLTDIPRMKEKIEAIRIHCEKKGLCFQYLTTPARFYNPTKQHEWTDFLTTPCTR